MIKIINIALLLSIMPLTWLFGPRVYLWEYEIFYGQAPDIGIGGIGLFGLLMPMLVIMLLTPIIFTFLTRVIPKSFHYILFFLVYTTILFVIMNPLFLKLLDRII